MAEGVALHLLAARSISSTMPAGVGAFADEDADAALPVHDGLQPRALRLDVDGKLRHVDRVDRLALAA